MLHSKLKSFTEKKDGTFLVVGAPGTGKTHVLLELVSYLLKKKKISPDRILVFSFNRRWAKILREKTSEDRGESLLEIPITSFFAFCSELIEKNVFINNPSAEPGLPSLNILSESQDAQYSGLKILTAPDQWKLLKEVISGKLDRKNYPYTFRFMESSPHIYRSYIQEVFDFILRAQENLLTPKVLSNKFTPFYNQVLSEIVGIYVNYLECLKNNGLYNYGRLLVDAVELLQKNKEFAEFLKKSYEFVIVDEFQEINRAQFEVVKQISNSNTILFGNDDECTYAFRGSMLNNFNSVYESLISGSSTFQSAASNLSEAAAKTSAMQPLDAPQTLRPPRLPAAQMPHKTLKTIAAMPAAAADGQFKNILLLEKNYRSNFVNNEVCQQFIEINKDRVSKKSQTHISHDCKEGAFETSEFKTVMDEITFICTRIKKLIFLKNIKPENICIIVKGIGYKTRLLENMLSGSNIPFMRRSSRTILENHYIKYILNFLKLIVLQTCAREESGQIEIQLTEALLCAGPVGLRPVFVKKIFGSMRKAIRQSPSHKERDRLKNSAMNKSDVANADRYYQYGSVGANTEYDAAGQCNMIINIKEFLKNNEAFLKSGNQKKSENKSKSPAMRESLYLKDLRRLADFISAFEKYVQLNSSGASVVKLIDELVNDSDIGILKHLLDRKKNPGFLTDNILSLLGDYLRTVNNFSESNPASNTAEKYLIFLEDIINNNFLEEIEESTKEVLKPGLINILSYHQCKGLEFDAVFLPFVNENYLPSPFGKTQLYDMQIFNYFTEGKSYSEDILKKKHLADERKLFYTGLTRAKNYAYVTSCSSEARSGFFEELDEIRVEIRKKMPAQNAKSIKQFNKSKTSEALKAEADGPFHMDYKSRRLASLEKWLVRKRAIAKTFKKNNNLLSGRDTLLEDHIFLKEMYPPQNWWSINNLSSNSNAPFKVIDQVFSYSALSSYLECPVKYKIIYYFRLRQEKNLSLLIGSIYHEIVKNFFEKNEGKLSWESLQREISDIFNLEKYRAFEFLYLKNEIFDKAVEDFKNYYESYVKGNVLKVSSERAFDFDIEGSRVKGRIDQINFISDEAVELIDFKSGKKSSPAISKDNEIQLRLYRMAIDLSSGLADLRGKEYAMKYIFLGDKKNRELTLDKNFYDFGQFYTFIKDAIKEIKKEKFGHGPKNSYTCKSCEYRIICSFKL